MALASTAGAGLPARPVLWECRVRILTSAPFPNGRSSSAAQITLPVRGRPCPAPSRPRPESRRATRRRRE
eukprot:4286741-Pyramimonas_sp.AAC.1